MKKSTLFFSLLLLATTTSAQGISFGHFQLEKKAKARLLQSVSMKRTSILSTRANIVPVEEFSELDEDRRYRYVYAYNANKERSSETIYMREREDDKWSDEILYTVGTYTYEYDTQGRVKTKSVTYDKTDIPFTSYRIMVTYNNDGSTTYTKYEHDTYDESYSEVESWTYRANGTLSSHTINDEYGGESKDKYTYDEQGIINGFNNWKLTGSSNNVTLTYESDYTPESNSVEHYVYDDKTGKLLEFWQSGEYDDTERYTYEYDTQGRIVSIKTYVGEEGEVIEGPSVELPTTRANTSGEIIWRLSFEENVTYFNEETYAVNNPWRVAFNFEGPVTSIVSKEYDTYAEGGDVNGDGVIDEKDDAANCEYESIITFTRDTDGRLIAVKRSDNEGAESVETGLVVSIDDEGQITSIKTEFNEEWNGGYDEEGNWDESIQNSYYSLEEQIYTWKDGKITQMKDHEKWENNDFKYSDKSEYSYTTQYSYSDNGVIKCKTQDDVNGGSAELTSISQIGNKYVVKHWYDYGNDTFDWETDDFIIRDIQTEDVSFIRPNLKKDREGFTAEVPIVLSRAGRVVCVGYESMGSGDNFLHSELDDNSYYLNIETEEDEYSSKDKLMGIYYSISHDGDLTIASNVEGLPVYVLKGNQIQKEYKYYDMEYSSNGMGNVGDGTRAIAIPAGQAYDEVSYIYNDNGLLIGQQLVSVDRDGVRTGEITLEYKYDANGIVHTEMSAQGHVCLNGRILGLDNGATFSIYTTSGQALAANVTSYEFAQRGIYIIVTNNTSIKLSVK